MASDSFVHLHVHTDYSMLDGAARIDELLDEAVRLEMPAIAITDHGNMFGAYEFWKHAKDRGITPIIGIEAYLTPGTHRSDKSRVRWGTQEQKDDDVSAGGAYTHMTMLAETTEGMHNLFRLSSLASIEGSYSKWSRMDRELLQRYGTGIIATTGCPSGEVQTRLRLGQYAEAKRAAGEFQEIFGKENFFAELMDHGLPIERRVQSDLIRLAKELGIPLVGTNDLHYVHAHDSRAQEVLLCINSGTTLDDPTRFKFDGDGYYLKSAAEMREVFRDYPEAIASTLLIAERAGVEFVEGEGLYMPRFPVPDGETEESWFRAEVEAGLRRRYPDGVTEAVRRRADYEMDVISQKGYPGYYLVVADFINWAKDNGVRVGPGRGSGAGSIAAYAMRITDLDPLEHGLIFERFLNPERRSMPDFDVDFDDRRRGEVIRYVTEKYGDERVAQIVTFGTIKAKQALKDAARVLGKEYRVGEELTKAMPDAIQGNDISLRDVFNPKAERFKEAADLRGIVDLDPQKREVFDTALGIEGLKRQWGVHAAGVIMSSEPLIDLIPIMKREQDGQIVTQFEYAKIAENLGLVKMDFLGLRNLTVLSDALDNIRSNRGIELDLESLSLDDPAAYELLSRGDTLGVFQFDSGGYQALCRQMRPDKFGDISALGALFRPGPIGMNSHTNYALRKNGQQAVDYIDPELTEALTPILEETYGLIVYQEQVMEIARQLAGYSFGRADSLRKAMGKKDKEVLAKEFIPFKEGMLANGYSERAIDTLWKTMEPFAEYGFNKAHSAAYGVISYWTAYLKANYPAEYMAALLTSTGENRDRLAVYLGECRRMRIRVLPPDVNSSIGYFAAVGDDIRFGLGAVRNVGFGVVDQIRAAREEKGAFASFHDFLRKVPLTALNKRTIESLIKAGAFDSLGTTRRSLIEIHEESVESAVAVKRNEANGQVGFDFDSLWDEPAAVDRVPERPEWSKKDKLAFEREMLGLYVSEHPLDGLEVLLAKHATIGIGQLLASETVEDGETVTIAGLLTSVQHRTARASGNPYGVVTVEDFGGEVSVMFLGKTYQEFAPGLQGDTIAVIKARVSHRDDGIGLHAQSMFLPDTGQSLGSGPLVIQVPEHRATTEVVSALGDVLIRHTGDTEVRLRLVRGESARLFEIPYPVAVTADLYGELKSLLGPNCVV
ncbi:MAG: DNA polymerase III subunit alpha [Protaetiibacter sp.]